MKFDCPSSNSIIQQHSEKNCLRQFIAKFMCGMEIKLMRIYKFSY